MVILGILLALAGMLGLKQLYQEPCVRITFSLTDSTIDIP